MNKSILENAIIINGEVYELIKDNSGNECEYCALKEHCKGGSPSFCVNVHDVRESNNRYQKVGTIEDVIARLEKRKKARHHIATLIKKLRWHHDLTEKKYKPVPSAEYIEAMNFAIQELKEKYK